jgi:hypothetical protein
MSYPQTYMPVVLSACNASDSRQWYSLMTSTGMLK